MKEMEENMEKHLFEYVPTNFFSLLASPTREMNADCLFITYDALRGRMSYACLKEEFVDLMTDYFENHYMNIPDDEIKGTPREKALAMLARFKEFGWVNIDDDSGNYEVYVTYTDYAIRILQTLFDLDHIHDITYSGLIYAIANCFRHFDLEHGYLAFDNAYKQTMVLGEKLQNLNSSIKKYIQKIYDEKKNESLNGLLDTLLKDFQIEVVDRAYYNLTTYDNPAKFQLEIIDNIDKIMSNDNLVELIIHQIKDRQGVDYDEASYILYHQAEFIKDSFDHIEDIMNEINLKHSRFVQSARVRIEFLLNNKKDIEGKINKIIRNLDDHMDITKMSQVAYLDEDSLYTPRIKTIKGDIEEVREIAWNEKDIQQRIARLHLTNRINKKTVDAMVLARLKEEESFLASSLPLETSEDAAYLALIFLYGYSHQASYCIELQDDLIEKNGYRFKEFVVGRKI